MEGGGGEKGGRDRWRGVVGKEGGVGEKDGGRGRKEGTERREEWTGSRGRKDGGEEGEGPAYLACLCLHSSCLWTGWLKARLQLSFLYSSGLVLL